MLRGENDLARVVVPGRELIHEQATLPYRQLPLVRVARRHRRRLNPRPGRLERYRKSQMARREAERGIEADVVHSTGHRFEADDFRASLLQPFDTGRHDHLPDALTLIVGMHREWTHPPLDPRAMDHVD